MSGKLTRRFLCLVICAISGTSLTANAQFRPPEPQVVYPPQLLADLAALRDAALTSDYAYRQAAHLSENIGPRMGGSPQAEAAAQYVAEQMRQVGLDVHL